MTMAPYEYYGDYSSVEPAVNSAFAGIGGFLLVFVLLFYLIMIGFGVAAYVLNALGMYTTAKRRGIRNPWLSWIPVADVWILGSISDQYQYVAKGKVRNRRKVLLGLYIALFVLLILILAASLIFAVSDLNGLDSDMLFGSALAVILLCYLAMLVVCVVVSVFAYIAYYDYFASCDPGSAVLYLVLGIFIPVTLPFFVFFNRKKDLGMPPRKQEHPAAIEVEPVEEDPAEEETPVAVENPIEEEPSAEEENPAEEEIPL